MLSHSDLKALSELLKVDDSSSSEDDLPKTGYASIGPGDIGKKTKIKIKGNEVENNIHSQPTDPKCIWAVDEVPEVPYSDDSLWDPRDKPQYEIHYKQAVGTEDIYLQMNNKTPTTASCECMVIVLSMEGESKDAIDCHVTKSNFDIRSPKYRLNLPLPHPVDPDQCCAEWDSVTSKLTVTFQLEREYDFINF